MQQATAADEVHGAPYSAPWSFQGVKWPTFLLVGFALAAFYFSHHYSFLLFHVLVEIFSVIVAFAIFLFAWNTRDKIHNSSLIGAQLAITSSPGTGTVVNVTGTT